MRWICYVINGFSFSRPKVLYQKIRLDVKFFPEGLVIKRDGLLENLTL